MAEQGWTVVSVPDGAIVAGNDADWADPAFQDALTACVAEAAPPLE